MKSNIELLAPAGDLDKLKTAIDFGADAVYFGAEMFSLRASSGNMSISDITEGLKYAHNLGKKGYMALNIYPHNEDITPLRKYLNEIKDIPIDAFIVSDPGVVYLLKEIIPGAEIHLSTQANMTNYETAKFWGSLGVKRLVLARELTFEEIKSMLENIPGSIELEAFVHGSMCISYSGRCLLSNFMIERDANRGQCAHPCRWNYSLVEEKRPGEYYPIEEDARGTYIMNSRDLCMIEHIPELINSGIKSFKIEGRMKSMYYVATVVRAYRIAIDTYLDDPDNFEFNDYWSKELEKASHREFTTGFYFHKPDNKDQNYLTSSYTRTFDFAGVIKGYEKETGLTVIEQRNKVSIGDKVEVFGPNPGHFEYVISEMFNEDGEPIESAPHAKQIIKINFNREFNPGYILRREKEVE
ncbi:MAG: U32 family peptidase [Peptostreptococcaceae bacterium]|nr:U32 family peptidase [Peptostreptococcaceae bacterium]